jgi:hypothetical protein
VGLSGHGGGELFAGVADGSFESSAAPETSEVEARTVASKGALAGGSFTAREYHGAGRGR